MIWRVRNITLSAAQHREDFYHSFLEPAGLVILSSRNYLCTTSSMTVSALEPLTLDLAAVLTDSSSDSWKLKTSQYFASTKAADPDQGECNNTSERIHKAKIQGLTRSGGLLQGGNHITVTILFFWNKEWRLSNKEDFYSFYLIFLKISHRAERIGLWLSKNLCSTRI